MLLMVVSGLGLWLMRCDANWLNLPRHAVRFPVLCMACLFLWGGLQHVPWSLDVISSLQPGAAETYRLIFPEGASTTLSMNTLVSWQHLLFFGALLFWTAGIIGSVNSKKAFTALAAAVLVVGTLQGLAGFLGFMGSGWLSAGPSQRMRGTFYGPNAFGGFLAVSLPISYGYMCCMYQKITRRHRNVIRAAASGSRRTRFHIVGLAFGLAGFLVQLGGLLMSASRGAIISSALVGVFLIVWCYRENPVKFRRASLGPLVVLTALILVFVTGGIFEYSFSRIDKALETDAAFTFNQRIFIWNDALKLLAAHPLGVGLGNFGLASHPFQSLGWQDIEYDFVHCDAIQWLTEWGIVGMISIVMLGFWLFRWSIIVWAPARKDSSLWIQRGAALSVYAGVIHALFDYNLSSRPGVSVTFFVSIGLLVAAGLYQRQGEAFTIAGWSLSPRRLATKALVLLVIWATLGTGPWLQRIKADVLHEKGWISNMRFRSHLFWLKVTFPDEQGEGFDTISRALHLQPRDDRIALDVGRIIMRPSEIEYLQAVENFKEEQPGQDHAWFRGIARDALRGKRRSALEKAIPYARAAVEHSRWNALNHAYLGLYLMEYIECLKLKHPEEHPDWEEGLQALQRAEALAPNLTRINSRLCRAYHAAFRSSKDPVFRAEVLRTGYETLKSSETYEEQVVEHYEDIGVDITELSNLGDFHPSPLFRLYTTASALQKEDESFALLDLIYRNIDHLPMPERRVLSPERVQEQQQTYFDAVSRERGRWNLRSGQWEAYAAQREELRGVAQRRVDDAMEEVIESNDAALIKLREMRDRHSLPPRYTLMWAELEAAKGHHKKYDDALAELAMHDVFTSHWPGEYKAVHFGDTSDNPNLGLRLCKARQAIREDRLLDGADQLRDVVDAFPSVFRYRHRLHFFRSQYENFRYNFSKAAFHLLDGLERCPTDPTLLEAAIEMGLGDKSIGLDLSEHCNVYELDERVRPTLPLGVQYFHGGMELMGIDLERSREMEGRVTCRLYCRFWKVIPGNLHVQLRLAHHTRSRIYTTQVSLEEQFPVLFGYGRPQIGAVAVVHAELPLHRLMSEDLQIGFYQANENRMVSADDGIGAIELLDWGRYVRLPQDVILPVSELVE